MEMSQLIYSVIARNNEREKRRERERKSYLYETHTRAGTYIFFLFSTLKILAMKRIKNLLKRIILSYMEY